MTKTDDFSRRYRNTMSLFATGVTVMVRSVGGEMRGMTANAVTSVSLDPTLLIVCPAKKAKIAEDIAVGDTFTLNILGEHQEALSSWYAKMIQEEPAHELVPWEAAGDAPRIADSLGSLACRVHALHEGGDHWIVVGEVTDLHQESENRAPLLFHGGRYAKLMPPAADA